MSDKESYSTEAVPPQERINSWQKQAESVLFPLEIDMEDQDEHEFVGTLVSQQVGAITIHEIRAPAHNVHHSKPVTLSGESAYIVVILQDLGEGYVSHGGNDVTLHPGDFTLIDATKAFDLKFPGPVKEFLVQVPWDAIRQDLISPDRIAGLAIQGNKGIGLIVSNFLRSFVKEAPNLSPPEVNSLTRSMIDMLNTAALSNLEESARESTGCQAFQLHQIRLYLEEHLRDADFTTAKVAEANGITQRYLHKLFEAEGISVARLIWERRLEHCRRDLENPYYSGKSITEIAYSWGFSSSSHFSRTFKERFSMSPREVRAAAVDSAKS